MKRNILSLLLLLSMVTPHGVDAGTWSDIKKDSKAAARSLKETTVEVGGKVKKEAVRAGKELKEDSREAGKEAGDWTGKLGREVKKGWKNFGAECRRLSDKVRRQVEEFFADEPESQKGKTAI